SFLVDGSTSRSDRTGAEAAILRGPNGRPRALYVHVPFCARRCSYCDFAVEAVRRAPTAGWLDAIEAELRLHTEREGLGRLELDTVYVGGGTPSLLGVGALPALLGRIGRHAALAAGAEVTAEANPESFTAEVA